MKMITTNASQPKSVVRLAQGPALTTSMKEAKPKYADNDPTTATPKAARLFRGQILTHANAQELLDNRPEVKAARMSALKATKAKKRERKAKKS